MKLIYILDLNIANGKEKGPKRILYNINYDGEIPETNIPNIGP